MGGDSDGDYHGEDGSDDDTHARAPQGVGARKRGNNGPGKGAGRKPQKAAWEDIIKRSWDDLVEGADGSLAGAIQGLAEAQKRARLFKDTTPTQRGIIRHLVLVLDMSFAMLEKDLLPSRYQLSMAYAADFVREYFEQNPISQLAIVGMKDGVAIRVSDISGNPSEHLERLRAWVSQEPSGSPSLQNALEMCRGTLFHTPSHGTREVVIIYGALMSSDPGDINNTIATLITDRIGVSVVGLAAHLAVCAELCSKTNGGSDSHYGVAQHEQRFRELLLEKTTPPVSREQSNASLLKMGFPSRTVVSGDAVSHCACHSRPTREGYDCTQCGSRVCRLPSDCPGCGLTLILSTHLARSYHHLFPLRNWVEVPWADAKTSKACFACLTPFPAADAAFRPAATAAARGGKVSKEQRDASANAASTTTQTTATKDKQQGKPAALKGLSESGRYACDVCGCHFCIDCDLFAHEVLHNCPGCQSGGAESARAQEDDDDERRRHDLAGGGVANGDAHVNGAMDMDA